MKRTLLLLLLTTVFLSVSALAEDRTEQEMLQIAEQQLFGNSNMAKGYGTVSAPTKLRKLKAGKNYHIYGADDTGFVIVSTDNHITPVLGYSLTSFKEDDMPCGFNWWLNAMNTAIENKLAKSTVSENTATGTSVSNFVSAEWGQGYPYNALCPTIDGEETPTGCVATAIAQIMYYYKYPEQGKGTGYYTLGDTEGRITGQIEGIYQWADMSDTYSKNETDESKVTVIATLLKDCGLAAGMNYTAGGSGAYSYVAVNGMINNFTYSSEAAKYCYRQFYTDSEWMKMIYNELDNLRPILYAASDDIYGGHAFVFSGYDEDGKIYVNWGWNGDANGFYDISNLAPEGILGAGGSQKYHFNSNQSMSVGLKRQSDIADDDEYQSSFGTNEPYTISKKTDKILEYSLGTYYNISYKQFNGTIGLYFENTDGNDTYSKLISIDESQSFNPLSGLKHNVEDSASPSLRSIKAGTYRVYLASKDDNENTPQPIRISGEGARYYIFTKNSDGTLVLSDPQNMGTSINEITIDVQPTCQIDKSVYDLNGRKVANGPTCNLKKGIYIQEGRKFVIK